MAYQKQTWGNTSSTPLSATRLNKLETQYDSVVADITDATSPVGQALTTTFVAAFAPTQSIAYDAAGNVSAVTENGIQTTYTYDAAGNVATETRQGKKRTWTYDANGNPTGSTVGDA